MGEMAQALPIYLYRTDDSGNRIARDGIIAYTLINHLAFYHKGIKILLIDFQAAPESEKANDNPDHSGSSLFQPMGVISYDGENFEPVPDILVNTRIVSRFKTRNFISAYVPDYGAIVFNTVQCGDLIDPGTFDFVYDGPLKLRLNQLICAIETASLVHLGRAKGTAAVRVIWRKERRLRRASAQIREKENLIAQREAHLMAVGAVTAEQLEAHPVVVHNGVYAFVDMVGSVGIRKKLTPRSYFDLLNLCHEIAARAAEKFNCRVDNFLGDGVFFESIDFFDPSDNCLPGMEERLMVMTCFLASFFNGIHLLSLGNHPLDPGKQVRTMVKENRISLGFRAGMSHGSALVGPLGSAHRKIVTAIGENVDLAARLESCGQVSHIHTTAAAGALLTDAWISKDTPGMYRLAAHEMKDRPGWFPNQRFPFFSFYRDWLSLEPPIILDRGDVSYKEFSKADTLLIRAVRQPGFTGTCAGI